jgi:hypothetical protein
MEHGLDKEDLLELYKVIASSFERDEREKL